MCFRPALDNYLCVQHMIIDMALRYTMTMGFDQLVKPVFESPLYYKNVLNKVQEVK